MRNPFAFRDVVTPSSSYLTSPYVRACLLTFYLQCLSEFTALHKVRQCKEGRAKHNGAEQSRTSCVCLHLDLVSFVHLPAPLPLPSSHPPFPFLRRILDVSTCCVRTSCTSARLCISVQDDNSCIDALFLRFLIFFLGPGPFSAGLKFFWLWRGVACMR